VAVGQLPRHQRNAGPEIKSGRNDIERLLMNKTLQEASKPGCGGDLDDSCGFIQLPFPSFLVGFKS
jgi:hypothetical protein